MILVRRIRLLLSLTCLVLCIASANTLLSYAQGSTPAGWPIVYEDTFEDPGSELSIGEGEASRKAYVDDAYEITVSQNDYLAWSTLPSHELYDFAIDLEVRSFDGQGALGILFRCANSRDYYCFEIRTDGYFRFRTAKKVGATHTAWKTNVNWTACDALHSEATNRISVVARGNTFTFGLNGIQIAKASDGRYRRGQIALSARALGESSFTVTFDAIVVRADPQAADAGAEANRALDQAQALRSAERTGDAIHGYEAVLTLYEEMEWDLLIAFCSSALANLYLDVDDYESAIFCLERAIAAWQAFGGDTYVTRYMSELILLAEKLAESGGLPESPENLSTWPIVYQSTLDGSAEDLLVREKESSRRGYVDGAYEIAILDDHHSVWSTVLDWNLFDFSVDIEVRDCQGEGGFGVVFRYENNRNYYSFVVRTDGSFWCGMKREDDLDTVLTETILDWTPCDAFHRQGANTITVVGRGNDLTFWLNGVLLATASHARYRCGEIGLLARTFEQGSFSARFDSVIVRTDPRSLGTSIEALIGETYADALRNESRPLEAITAYEETLAQFEAMGWHMWIAICSGALGDLHLSEYDSRSAAPHLTKAVSSWQAVCEFGSVSVVLRKLAGAYLPTSDYRFLGELYETALGYEYALGADWNSSIADCLVGLGNYHAAVFDCVRASELYEEALTTYRHLIADYESEDLTDPFDVSFWRSFRASEARCLRGLAGCWAALGHLPQAIESAEESLAICREIRSQAGEAQSLSDLGYCYYSLCDYELAITLFLQALEISHDIGDLSGKALELYNLGLCYERLSMSSDAIACFEASLSFSELAEARATALLAHWGLGRVHWKMDESATALGRYEVAIGIVESIRGTVPTEQLRSSYTVGYRSLYEQYIQLLLDVGQDGTAFVVSERSRARAFLDLVATGPIGTLDSVAEEGIRSGVVDARSVEADLAQVVRDIPARTAALEYFVTDEATYVWIVRDGFAGKPIQIKIDRDDLRDSILAFRIGVETTTATPSDSTEESTLTMSRDLYDLLLAPIEDQLVGVDHLVIVPSGPLYYMPFSALLDCSDCEGMDLLGGTYLIERYRLSYTPSLTILKYARESAANTLTEPLLLVLADPDSGDPTLSRLPDAREEATAVAGLSGASEIYVDRDATEEVIVSRAGSVDQLLLSTHGVFNPMNPMYSYLSLSPTQGSDGRLYTHEILSLDLHTDLVTLSACETLLPALAAMEDDFRAVRGMPADEDVELSEGLLTSLTAGDEIVGLTRAFIYAGTPSVLSTLWRVVSETTEPLMVGFYTYLQQGLDKAEALRLAQLDVMAMYPHPRYWAAFELVGDWR